MVYGEILSELAEDDNNILKILGFPVGDELSAPTSIVQFRDTYGNVQYFAGGKIHSETKWINGVYYLPKKIADYHDDNGTTGGRFGFPISDPKKIKHENGDTEWYQAFENDEEIHVKTDGTVETVGLAYYRCQTNESSVFAFPHGLINGLGDLVEAVGVDLPTLGSVNKMFMR